MAALPSSPHSTCPHTGAPGAHPRDCGAPGCCCVGCSKLVSQEGVPPTERIPYRGRCGPRRARDTQAGGSRADRAKAGAHRPGGTCAQALTRRGWAVLLWGKGGGGEGTHQPGVSTGPGRMPGVTCRPRCVGSMRAASLPRKRQDVPTGSWAAQGSQLHHWWESQPLTSSQCDLQRRVPFPCSICRQDLLSVSELMLDKHWGQPIDQLTK